MSANAIHDSFKQIAERYSIPEDQISRILESIKIKSSVKPSGEQIRGFEKVCQMFQSGVELELAVQSIHEEAKKSNKAQKENGEGLITGKDQPKNEEVKHQIDARISEQAKQVAKATAENILKMAVDYNERSEEAFNQRYYPCLIEELESPSFKERFSAAMEGRDMGKPQRLLESQTLNIALPGNSSSSS